LSLFVCKGDVELIKKWNLEYIRNFGMSAFLYKMRYDETIVDPLLSEPRKLMYIEFPVHCLLTEPSTTYDVATRGADVITELEANFSVFELIDLGIDEVWGADLIMKGDIVKLFNAYFDVTVVNFGSYFDMVGPVSVNVSLKRAEHYVPERKDILEFKPGKFYPIIEFRRS
jgi:hypothetical protein